MACKWYHANTRLGIFIRHVYLDGLIISIVLTQLTLFDHQEARAVFRQTLAGATYHLNGVAQKLGKCVDKSRPFYESYRQLRQVRALC